MKKKRKRKLRSEAVIILTLTGLLTFLLLSMGLSLLLSGGETSNPMDLINPPAPVETKGTIVLDPGHGGHDGGADFNGNYEKEYTLPVALAAGKILEKNGYTVIYTRDDDSALGEDEVADLTARVAIGENAKADLFVSLHMNTTDILTERIYGFEVYQNEVSDTSMKLAENIITAFSAVNYSQSRGTLNGETLQVVINNRVPAVLVELGFLSDEEDRNYIGSMIGQKALGKALAEAIEQTMTSEEAK